MKRQETNSSEYTPEPRNLDYTPRPLQPTEMPPQVHYSQEPVVSEVEENEKNNPNKKRKIITNNVCLSIFLHHFAKILVSSLVKLNM